VRVTDDGTPPSSATVTFTVAVAAPADVRLAAAVLPGGVFVLTIAGDVGRTYFVEVSEDLIDWALLTDVVATAATVEVRDPMAAGVGARFYRVVSP